MLTALGCGDSNTPDPLSPLTADIGVDLDEVSEAKALLHKVDLTLDTFLSNGTVTVWHLLDGEIKQLENRRFDYQNPELYLSYLAPETTPDSHVLIHTTQTGSLDEGVLEFVCFARLDHQTTRHEVTASCGYWQTVAYYFAAQQIGQSFHHPFHDIQDRLPLWAAISGADDNDIHGFYTSVFGTLQNALADLGYDRFDLKRHSLRPVMESVVSEFRDQFQRTGSITAADLMRIANRITDHALPLERITRFQSIYKDYEYVESVQLKNTGGTLTRRTDRIDLLTMESELRRFYLQRSPYEMSDYRTQIVQSIQHATRPDGILLSWHPIAHMFGYNVYLNSEFVGFTRIPGHLLTSQARGTVTIRAVGYAGEFDGVSHELSGPTLIAGPSS